MLLYGICCGIAWHHANEVLNALIRIIWTYFVNLWYDMICTSAYICVYMIPGGHPPRPVTSQSTLTCTRLLFGAVGMRGDNVYRIILYYWHYGRYSILDWPGCDLPALESPRGVFSINVAALCIDILSRTFVFYVHTYIHTRYDICDAAWTLHYTSSYNIYFVPAYHSIPYHHTSVWLSM